jgi:hypothetical protein
MGCLRNSIIKYLVKFLMFGWNSKDTVLIGPLFLQVMP